MQPLNLPPATLRIAPRDGRDDVFDILRRRYVALTPEEWVRQHFVHYLIDHLSYPAALLANEVPLAVGTMQKRCDTVLFDRSSRPVMIVEYKAPTVRLTQKVFDQITRYNMALHVPYLIVSNGLTHYCCHVDYARRSYTFLRDVPAYDAL